MATTNAAKSFEARELHLKTVTVFTDRAEVVRVFSVDLEAGLSDVIVNNVADTLDSESIRVSAPGVTIQKVEFKKSQAKDAQVDSPKVKQLLAEQKTLRSKLATQKRLVEIYNTRIEALDNIVTSVCVTHDRHRTDYVVVGRNFGSLEELFSYHAEMISKVNLLLQGVESEIADLEPQDEDLQQKIQKTRRSEAKQKSIIISLEADAKKKVDLKLTYQVNRARWSPSYDLRVTSDKKSPKTKQAKLHYCAIIEQATGEDWKDAAIELSTAEPRRADPAPKLETLNAKMRPRPVKTRVHVIDNDDQYEMINRPRVITRCSRERKQDYPTMNDVLSDWSSEEDVNATKFKEMRVQKHALSTSFKLPQKTSIPSDSSEHKVTLVS
ncbi:Conserved hypothetical protein CHP02231 [Aphelenchoides avenae]|nr:Conserved hypothetical protein CHP02231 [Aphelenchus avenae]